MKKIVSLVIAVLALAIPSTVSAHTGSVTATCTTVTFAYNANFAHDTTATETIVVDGKQTVKTFLVPANHAASDVITFASPNKASFVITAGATWIDGQQAGSIPTTTFTPSECAVVCVPKTETVYVDRVVYVDREVPGPTVEVPGPVTTVTKFVDRWHKAKTKIVYRDRWHTKIRLVEWHRLPVPPRPPGVTG